MSSESTTTSSTTSSTMCERMPQQQPPTAIPTSTITPTPISAAGRLTQDPISLILPFLTMREFATSAAAISRVWYSTAQTMRSRHDRCTINYFQDHNQPQHQLLHTSSLRHHVTHLHAQLFSPIKDEIKLASGSPSSDATVAAVAYRHPSHLDQLNWFNMISHSMSHIKSLEVHLLLSPNDSTDSQQTAQSIHFPPRLLSLRFEVTFENPFQSSTSTIEENEYHAGRESALSESDGYLHRTSVLFEKCMVRFFTAITASKSLCASLLILESVMAGPPEYRTPIVASTSLHKLTNLRRLALHASSSIYSVDDAFLDAIRTIPKLCEFEGTSESKFSYLLRAPCQQPYSRIGGSAIASHSSIDFGDSASWGGRRSAQMVDPKFLLTSSAHSLTDLTASIHISPTFLPRFTRLRYLNVICEPDISFTITGPQPVPSPFDIEDLVAALSQCHTLERLIINWQMGEELLESDVERIVTPLHQLDYLSIKCVNQIGSLSFLSRMPHLISGLRYFICQCRFPSLSDYRILYSLTQLRLLCVEARGGDDDVTPAALDAMFRPRSQVRASYLKRMWDSEPALLGPGELPQQYLPHLKHFVQSDRRRSDVKEWQELIEETERKRKEELLSSS